MAVACLRQMIHRIIFVVVFLSFTNTVFSVTDEVTANNLALIVNIEDANSVAIAKYYQQQRKIPDKNIIRVKVSSIKENIEPDLFNIIKQEIDRKTTDNIQAFAIAWTEPYRVGCMSLTSALAFGYDKSWCATGCEKTKVSPYFNSRTRSPYIMHKMRPAMMLAGEDKEQIKALIDRGVKSDVDHPTGTAYLMDTSDKNRNVRSILYPEIKKYLSDKFSIQHIKKDSLEGKEDVLFYFTGKKVVEDLETNKFLPGAIADHLTSHGGQLTNSKDQMSALKWLEAGATASYGAVVEPCNFLEKFPHPGIVMQNYLNGDTAIEAYWKSVAMPGQGVFIGEPLARPFQPIYVLSK